MSAVIDAHPPLQWAGGESLQKCAGSRIVHDDIVVSVHNEHGHTDVRGCIGKLPCTRSIQVGVRPFWNARSPRGRFADDREATAVDASTAAEALPQKLMFTPSEYMRPSTLYDDGKVLPEFDVVSAASLPTTGGSFSNTSTMPRLTRTLSISV
jgi:hypothetical protein